MEWLNIVPSAINARFQYLIDLQNSADFSFYAWLFWLWWPFILVTVILPTLIIVLLYLSCCLCHIHRIRDNLSKFKEKNLIDPNAKARTGVSLLWDCHGWIWHGYEIVNMERIPRDKGALIVYYHGVIPVDYYYFMCKFFLLTQKCFYAIAAEFLFKWPGLRLLLEVANATPGTVQQIAELLRNDELVAVSPGGVREAQFSNEYYELVWNGHLGFAKAAILGKAPIIPVYTQNIQEAFRTAPFLRGFARKIFEKIKIPVLPVYGGFPVKLRTIVGEPIPYVEGATPEEVAEKTAEAIRCLIQKHQRLPGNITAALLDRFRY